MKWMEVSISTSTEAADLIAEIFFSQGCEGVSVIDRNDIIEFMNGKRTWDYIDENVMEKLPLNPVVQGFLPIEDFSEQLKSLTLELNKFAERNKGILKYGSLEIKTREIEDTDWYNVWKQYYKPITISNVVICPMWIKYSNENNKTVVLIDPGMAFGTGEHETTSMCIELMQEYDLKDKTVFDIGCGSGILGITALKLGANRVRMTDIDIVAVDAAKMNAKLNNLDFSKIEIRLSDLLKDANEVCDVAISNITANVLLTMKDDLKEKIKSGGILILSGIIKEMFDETVSAFANAGFELEKTINKGDWYGISLKLK